MGSTTVDANGFPKEHYLNQQKGIASWLLTVDHKRIGVMYLATTLLFFLVGGLFALAVRTELWGAGPTVMDAQTYNRMFTLHGMAMIFLFMIPAIPGIFGNFMLPLMLGAKDVAFPKLNLLSYYLYLLGALFTVSAIVNGGADTGWTFYAPYSTTTATKLWPIMAGVFIGGLASIVTGLNFITTVHTLRAPGMTWTNMPLFVWALYGSSLITVLATPVLGLVVFLVGVENALGFGLFDPSRGGDPLLMQHLFWFYSHPTVYIMILPAMGIISEVFATFSRRQVFGYKMLAGSTLGIALVGFFVWGHHMFVSGQGTFNAGIFGVLSMLVGVFTAVKLFNWIMTLYRGAVQMSPALMFGLMFIYFLIFGGMTGIAIAVVSLDVHWHDTYFVVAHFHFVMVGSVISAFLAGLYYWWPKMFGKMTTDALGYVSSLLVFAGFNLTFVPQFLLGNLGMPRRYYMYDPIFEPLNKLSTVGAFILGLGFCAVAVNLVMALIKGKVAGASPFYSRGLEWQASSPPDMHNFIDEPIIEVAPHDYSYPEPTGGAVHAR